MATFTIFGTGAPTGVTASGDTSAIAVSTGFYVLGVTGWRVQGIRFWIPAGTTIASSGQKAYLWIGTTNTPDSILATADFSGVTAGAWNVVFFSSPVNLIAGRYYWAQVHHPAGGYGVTVSKFSTPGSTVSVDTPVLFAAAASEITTGQGSYVTGAPGQAPTNNFNSTWYGVDVLIDDGTGASGPGANDNVGIADAVVTVRSGLPSAIHATGSAADALGLSASATGTFPVGGATAFHTKRRGLFETRIAWGAVTNANVAGPDFLTDPSGSLTLGVEFHVQWPVRFVGGRIYKAPNCHGSIPVRLWDMQGAGGVARQLGISTVTWVADGGGWQDVTFSPPIALEANINYTMSYYSPTSDYAMSDYVFFWWSDVVSPMVVNTYASAGTTRTGGSAYRLGSAQQIPDQHTPANYYIEPIVEWDDTEPVFVPDPQQSYYDQWVNGKPNHKFMIGIFFADPPYLQGYADMGFNTLLAGYGTPEYVTAVKAAGLDHYPFVSMFDDPERIGLRAVQEDAAYAALVKGYMVIDEPDQFAPFSPPSTIRTWCNEIRQIDSTRPTYIGMGRLPGVNQSFTHQPQGSNMDVANELWSGWAKLPDILSGDFYALSPESDPDHRWGVWIYPVYVRRLRNLNEGRTPIMVTVETTSEVAGYPVIENVRKATWACIIEGCNGIEYFDHRFGNYSVSRDFAAMLHDPPMKAMVTALIIRINSMVDAINSPNTHRVTAVTSSNTTQGPYGGIFGVPMHYTTRSDSTYEYLWAMGIRPGSTTATFTIPAWAGQTLTVIDESRTITVDGSGILVDNFPADYTVHLYRKG
jgi:hypothetical protein